MRSFLITIVLAVGVAAAGAYFLDLIPNDIVGPVEPPPPPPIPTVKLGKALYEPQRKFNPLQPKPKLGPDDIVIGNCHLISTQSQEVATNREGLLLLVGSKLDDAEAAKTKDTEIVHIEAGSKEDTRVVKYKPWQVGDLVEPNAVLAMVDPAMALNELSSAQMDVIMAQMEHKVAERTMDEAESQMKTSKELLAQRAITEEKFRLSRLTFERHRAEYQAKAKAIEQANFKLAQANILYNQHYLYNKMSGAGLIKRIYHNRGDAVKSMEPVMSIYNIDKLRSEGLVDSAYRNYLTKDMPVVVEPHEEQPSFRRLGGALGKINSVAVTGDKDTPFFVSRVDSGGDGIEILGASEDGNVYIWSVSSNIPIRNLPHANRKGHYPNPVRVVVSSYNKAKKRNWCLSGCVDGTIHLWDLDNPEDKALWVKSQTDVDNGAPISALAISPDGKFFASGSEDNSICVWELETGKKLYTFDAAHGVIDPHQGPITSLKFTPQTKLVSASQDNTLRVWDLFEKGATLVMNVPGRSGTVNHLDVDPQGRYMLYDKGRTLQMLSLEGNHIRSVGFVNNLSNAGAFEELAILSPDSYMMLTSSGSNGSLQLWKTPENGRAMEVRQFVTERGVSHTLTSAAFAPNNDFVVAGYEEGHINIYALPTKQDVENHPIRNLKLDLVDTGLAGAQQIRIGVTITNPQDPRYPNERRLAPGQSVSVVLQPGL